MKLKIFSIGLLIFMSFLKDVTGQDTTKAEVNTKKYIQFKVSGGYFRSTNTSFNEAMQREGFNKIPLDMFQGSVSMEYFSRRGVLIAGKVFYFQSQSKKQPNNYETSIDGYGFAMTFGYALVKNNNLRLYPYGGVGSYETRLRFYNPDYIYQNSLSAKLNDPSRDLDLFLGATLPSLEIGVGVDKMLEMKRKEMDCPHNTRYLVASIKVGYHYTRQMRSTYVDNYSLNGFYANLSLGMGTKIRKVKWN